MKVFDLARFERPPRRLRFGSRRWRTRTWRRIVRVLGPWLAMLNGASPIRGRPAQHIALDATLVFAGRELLDAIDQKRSRTTGGDETRFECVVRDRVAFFLDHGTDSIERLTGG